MPDLRRILILLLLSLLLAVPAVFGVPGAPGQSISTSRQFIVYGTRVALRGAICDLAEQTKRELLGLLDERDQWVTPIVLNAQYSEANLPERPRLAINVGQTGFGLKLQLDLLVDAEVSAPEVRREILRALLLEIMYRGDSNLPAGATYTAPPDWLLEGIPAERSDFSRDRLAHLLSLPVKAGTVLSLENFARQRPELLDAAGRLLYRGYAAALVDFLSRTDPHRLTAFIRQLPSASNDPIEALRKFFPGEFGSVEAAEKTWQQQVARFSARQPYELLGIGETERMLTDKLRLKIREKAAAKTYELAEFAAFIREPGARPALAFLTQDLRALALQANPIFAPVVAEYAQITERLARGKTGGVAGRLERLATVRHALGQQMHGIDDYLNWFEATSLAEPSGAFAGYLKAAESAARPERSRRDPISVYLDAIETQFQN